MSNDRQGLIGIVYNISTPSIVRGSDAFIEAQINYQGEKLDPYSFASFVGASAYFPGDPNQNVTSVVVVGTLVSADLGLLKFQIPAASTPLLQVQDGLSWETRFQDARGLTIIQFDSSLSVADKLF
jgi:hypothetical protein